MPSPSQTLILLLMRLTMKIVVNEDQTMKIVVNEDQTKKIHSLGNS